MPILQSSVTYTGFDGLALVLLFGAAIAGGLFVIVLGWRWLATRPRRPDAGPSTNELGPETPALANLLVHHFRATHLAVPATIIDLAARRYLGIEQYGENVVVRVRNIPAAGDTLAPYEGQVLALVGSGATGGSAPFEAIDLGDDAAAESWWKRFANAVREEANERGYIQERWRRSDWVTLGLSLGAALGLLALAFGEAGLGAKVNADDPLDRSDWLVAAGFAWVGVLFVISRTQDVRDTPLGREVAARWLGVRRYLDEQDAFEAAPPGAVTIWERYLSYAVGLGVAHEATERLRILAQDPETAWSRESGHWRELRVRYPRRLGFGLSPGRAAWEGLKRAAPAGLIVFIAVPTLVRILLDLRSDFDVGSGLVVGIAAGIAVLTLMPVFYLALGLAYLYRGLADMVQKPVEEQGVVVKRHEGRVAIDDGVAREIVAWTPPPGAGSPDRGDRVRIVRTPNLFHVRSLQAADLPRRPELTAQRG